MILRVCCQCRRECRGSKDHPYGPVLTEREQENATHTYCWPCFNVTFGNMPDPETEVRRV